MYIGSGVIIMLSNIGTGQLLPALNLSLSPIIFLSQATSSSSGWPLPWEPACAHLLLRGQGRRLPHHRTSKVGLFSTICVFCTFFVIAISIVSFFARCWCFVLITTAPNLILFSTDIIQILLHRLFVCWCFVLLNNAGPPILFPFQQSSSEFCFIVCFIYCFYCLLLCLYVCCIHCFYCLLMFCSSIK